MSQFINLTAPTKNIVSIRKDTILSVYSEHYNTIPATFIKLGLGSGQYVLETREWIIQSLEHPDKPNNIEKWMKPKEPIVTPKSSSPPQETKGGTKSPPKAPNSTPKAAITKPAPKSQVAKKGPPKRK